MSDILTLPSLITRPQELFGPYDFCETPQSEVIVFLCGDPRYRHSNKLFIKTGIGLGATSEQYIQMPIPGGAALFAHLAQLRDYYDVIVDCLETYCTHFEGVTRLILLGHSGCKHMAKIYDRLGIVANGVDLIRRDLESVVRAYEAKSEQSSCLISRLFAKFRVDAEVYYMRPSTRVHDKVDVERIRV